VVSEQQPTTVMEKRPSEKEKGIKSSPSKEKGDAVPRKARENQKNLSKSKKSILENTKPKDDRKKGIALLAKKGKQKNGHLAFPKTRSFPQSSPSLIKKRKGGNQNRALFLVCD